MILCFVTVGNYIVALTHVESGRIVCLQIFRDRQSAIRGLRYVIQLSDEGKDYSIHSLRLGRLCFREACQKALNYILCFSIVASFARFMTGKEECRPRADQNVFITGCDRKWFPTLERDGSGRGQPKLGESWRPGGLWYQVFTIRPACALFYKQPAIVSGFSPGAEESRERGCGSRWFVLGQRNALRKRGVAAGIRRTGSDRRTRTSGNVFGTVIGLVPRIMETAPKRKWKAFIVQS